MDFKTRLVIALATLYSLLRLCSAGAEQKEPNFADSIVGDFVEVSFEMDGRRPAPIFEFGFPDTHESSGRPGRYDRLARMEVAETYSIHIRVRDASKRFSVCIFIDGRHVIGKQPITGAIEQISTCRKASPDDYIVSRDSDMIEGWRKSPTDQQVTKFLVDSAAKSVGAVNDRLSPRIGVIAISVFSEAPKVQAKVAAKIGTRGMGPIGTTEGEVVDSRVDTTQFKVQGEVAVETYYIRYATGATLQALGVLPRGNGAQISK